MADRDDSERIAPSLGVDARPGGSGGIGRPRAERPRRWPKLFHSFHDEVAFEGIPANEFTPAVQEAFRRIMGEYDALHRRLDQVLEHQKLLEKQADLHAFLPILNQRALMRELGRLLAVGDSSSVAGTFVLLHVRNADEIRARHGISTLQALLAGAAERLVRDLRGSDIVGGVGDTDIAIVLALTERDAAGIKAEELVQRMGEAVQVQDGAETRLATIFGLRRLARGDHPSMVLEAAERDLRQREAHSPAGIRR